MIAGVPVESSPHEQRVALVPAVVPTLIKAGLQVLVEPGAGEKAGFPDAAYQEQGARLAPDRNQLFSSADLVLQVQGLTPNSAAQSPDMEIVSRGPDRVGSS